MRIFISYARQDQAAVEALNADLERARFQAARTTGALHSCFTLYTWHAHARYSVSIPPSVGY
jgi:hypothetical protein